MRPAEIQPSSCRFVHCAHLSPHPNHHPNLLHRINLLTRLNTPINRPPLSFTAAAALPGECMRAGGAGGVSERTRQHVRSESRDSAEAQPSPPSLVVSAAPVGRPPQPRCSRCAHEEQRPLTAQRAGPAAT